MISLPTETDEDVIAIGELAAKCAQIARRNGVKNPTISIGVSRLRSQTLHAVPVARAGHRRRRSTASSRC